MQRYYLDPLNEVIGFTQYDDANWGVFVTVEGCSKLLNRNKQFNWLLFSQSDQLINGVPEWNERSIYWPDRIMPIKVREYFIQVKKPPNLAKDG